MHDQLNATYIWFQNVIIYNMSFFAMKCTFKSNQTFVLLPVSITANMCSRTEDFSSTTVLVKTGAGRQVAGSVFWSVHNTCDTLRILRNVDMKDSITAQHMVIEQSVNICTTALKDTGKQCINVCRVFVFTEIPNLFEWDVL